MLDRPLERTDAVGWFRCTVCGGKQYTRAGADCELDKGKCPGSVGWEPE